MKPIIKNRYDLATAIGLFLVGKGMNVWDRWEGRMTAKEQRDAFGAYMGRGKIVVDGENDNVYMVVTICFGTDYQVEVNLDARNPIESYDNRAASSGVLTEAQKIINQIQA